MVSTVDIPVLPATGSSTAASAALLIVEENAVLREFLAEALHDECAILETVDDLQGAESMCRRCAFDLIVINTRVAEHSGIEWIQSQRERGIESDVIFLAQDQGMMSAIAALRLGAVDYLCAPFQHLQVEATVRRCLDQRQGRTRVATHQQQTVEWGEEIIGDSEGMSAVRLAIARFAPTSSTILIEGDTGTGKELVAQSLHRFSGRRGEFVALNCGAIASELLESELFGHTRGAFTGAQEARPGMLMFADGGTLFLDEISEMSPPMQIKLLRAIEQKVVRPVGAEREVSVDFRLIAATNRKLEVEVARGRFRSDLYYRINVVTIHLPALRQRTGDIELLIQHYSTRLAADLGVPLLKFNGRQMQQLRDYDWPGNVRELRNVIERSLLSGELCFDFHDRESRGDHSHAVTEIDQPPLAYTLAEVEKAHALRVLASVDGNKSESARRLGISRKTLERKVKDWREQDE